MLPFSMSCLILSLTCGVFGFGTGAAPSWKFAQAMFALLFIIAIVSLFLGTHRGCQMLLVHVGKDQIQGN